MFFFSFGEFYKKNERKIRDVRWCGRVIRCSGMCWFSCMSVCTIVGDRIANFIACYEVDCDPSTARLIIAIRNVMRIRNSLKIATLCSITTHLIVTVPCCPQTKDSRYPPSHKCGYVCRT